MLAFVNQKNVWCPEISEPGSGKSKFLATGLLWLRHCLWSSQLLGIAWHQIKDNSFNLACVMTRRNGLNLSDL